MGRQAGYTIVEVTLFLAVTGLLILGVITGFNGTLSNNQKTDSTRSFESVLQSVYSSVRSGEFTRQVDATGKATCKIQTAYPGASDECVVIGKLLHFSSGSMINVYNVVANITADPICNATNLEALTCYHPTVLDTANAIDSFAPMWQAKVGQVAFYDTASSSYDTFNMIAFLRHPASELVYVAPINDMTFTASPSYELTVPNLNNDHANTKGQVCLVHDGFPVRKTYVRFNGGEGVGAIDTSETPLTGAPAC